MSIGNELRQAREAQSLSLDQAAQATHIRLRYLEALEADQFDLLPSVAQLRGFLRAYSEYLKLNPRQLIQALDGELKVNPVVSTPPPAAGEMPPPGTSSEAIFKALGEKLRHQRELMGLSLEDVERHTHIRMHYVVALEEGDLSHLPSPVQGRGMLSNYASFLGLNQETVLLQFADGLQARLYDRQAANPKQSRHARAASGRLPTKPSQLRRLFSMDLFVGGFLIIFLMGFTIWGALRISALNSAKKPTPTAPPVSEILLSTTTMTFSTPGTTPLQTGEISTQLPPAAETVVITGAVQLLLTETPAVFEPTPRTGTEPIQLYIVAQQRAWMRITVDGDIAFEGRVTPGTAYAFAGNDRIEFLTGDGGGLQVYYNQQDLGFLGTFGEVVARVFTIHGIQTATYAVPPTGTPVPTGTISITPTATSKSLTATASPTQAP